jgi:hypothetical protein
MIPPPNIDYGFNEFAAQVIKKAALIILKMSGLN